MAAIEDQDFVLLDEKDVEDFNAAGLLPESSEELEKIQQWLQPTNFSSDSSEYNKHLASYVAGTGKWIQETEQYQQWIKSSDHGTLWIKAVPGAGKSVVAAHLASQLAKEEKVPVLHFFFRQIITTNKTPQSLVRDWISQVLGYSPLLQSKLKVLLKNNRHPESVALDELWDNLITSFDSLPRVYCIADALDEMDMGNEPFLRQLIILGKRRPSSVKILMTSRPLPRIETVLNERSVLEIPLRLPLIDHDIAIYVRSRLSAIDLLEETKMEIRQTIRSKSEGLFLYARLMMDDLIDSDKLHIDRIHDALSKLPSGLGDMYTAMLFDHSKRSEVSQELQFLILQFVTHSSRPLRLLEIASMIDFVRKTIKPDLVLTATGIRQDTKSIIRAGCGPLLEILEDETVSPIHLSFAEFLIDPDRAADGPNHFPRIDFAMTHRTMALVSIDYLRSNWFNGWEISNDRPNAYDKRNSSARIVRMKYPFLDYAINYWHHHLSEYDESDDEINLKLDSLMEPKSKSFLSCLDLMGVDSRLGKVSPIHVAGAKGLHHYIAHLLQLGQDFNVLDPESRTTLHRAAEHGHHRVAQILLEHGAANDLDDYAGLKPLHLAASNNHPAVIKLLLESGVDPFTRKTKEHPGNWCGNAPRSTGETPVEYACTFGHTESVRVFITFLDADGLGKALCWAAGCGRTDVVLAILESPMVDVNKMIDNKTPIHLAAHARDIPSMQRLLDLGADTNIKCNTVFGKQGIQAIEAGDELKASPLHVYASSCRQGLVKGSLSETLRGFRMLLKAGCDINEFDAFGQTPFHHLLSGGGQFDKNCCPQEILAFLLENGAKNSGTKYGFQPLHLIQGDAEDIIDLLVAKGADVNARQPVDGRTPLFKAVASYHDTNFMALLRHGADVNAQDKNGDSPLHIAITQATVSNLKTKTLLSHGANPNAQNKNGETPLHAVRSYVPSDETLSLLLEAKADLELKTDAGLTVLLKAVKNNTNLTDIMNLIKAGARVDACDFKGRSVLHLACEQIRTAAPLIHALVEAGADATAKDFAGNTILHQAARSAPDYKQNEQLLLLETILDLGVSPSSRNYAGQTPFYIAAGMQRSRLMTMYKTDPYEFLLGPKCNSDANEPDNMGIRPIHLAATLSEVQFLRLIDEGADPFAMTVEGQSVLQIAARARQSNIVGIVLEILKDLGKSSLVNHVDKEGRTALHYAVKSGRLESVKLLLEAGADANLKDSKYCTPLDMCLQFKAEDFHWSHPLSGEEAYVDAAYMLLTDSRRPRDDIYYNSTPGSSMSSENQTVGVRQIVRSLIAHGADISFLTSSGLRKSYGGRSNLLDSAMASDDEVLVDELLGIAESRPVVESTEEESEWRYYVPWDDFKERYVRLRPQAIAGLLYGTIKKDENNIHIFHQLLKTENEWGIEQMQRLGADLLKPDSNGESCLTILAKWGYASLLEEFGAQASMIDEPWFREIEKTDINLPGRLRPILHIGCQRSLPNFDVLKVLVEKLGVNVSCKSQNDENGTALHILAESRHWWQAGALEYLIEKGADIETKDNAGCSPLHIAASNKKRRTVEILLAKGADPNVLDSDGKSCLNKAASDPAIAHLLVRYGADISAGKKPFIFNAIESMDLPTVDLVIEMKANLNCRPTPDKEEEPGDEDEMDFFAAQQRLWASMVDISEKSYPIHFAAQKKFNTAELRPKMIPIIKSLLRGGADPMLPFNKEGDPVLHEICESEGIIEPFLDAPNIDLEARDSKGRTPLLATCATPHGWHIQGQGWTYPRPNSAELLFEKGVDITATDNGGRNVLHHLLETDDGCHNNRKSTKPTFELFLSQPQGTALAAQKDAAGSTPLHYALRNRALWAVDMLLDKGADPHLSDPYGNTALHHICAQFTPIDYNSPNPLVFSLFDKFLSLGLDISALNNLGQPPIFKFFSENSSYLKNLPKLLDAGADLKMKDNKGQGLLHVVAKKPYEQSHNLARFNKNGLNPDVENFKWLMEKGLGMDEDSEQRTPLDVAAASGHTGILELFKRTK